jgi:hypothetical protein
MIFPFVRLFFCASVSTVNCVWKIDLKVMVPSFVVTLIDYLKQIFFLMLLINCSDLTVFLQDLLL